MPEDVSIEEERLLCRVLADALSPTWQAAVDIFGYVVLTLLRLLDTCMTPHDKYGDMFCFSAFHGYHRCTLG